MPTPKKPKDRLRLLGNDIIKANIAPIGGLNPKDQAVRNYGLLSALKSEATTKRDAAKKSLETLGLLDGYDGVAYTLTKTTALGSSRLDSAALDAALEVEGLSRAMRRRIIKAATVEIKAAVSYVVTSK